MPTAPHLRRAWFVVFALFVGLRLVHVAQLVDSPALVQHHWPDSDMFAFDHWARNIAGGDLLSQRAQRPLTSWHRDVAADWLRLQPQVPVPTPTAETLWSQWQGSPRFYQEPAFAHLLGGLYALVGPSPLLALILQMLIGFAGLWLLMDASRRLLGEREAVLAGLLATFCGPLAYYESLLLRETLAVMTTWLLIQQWAVARDRIDVRAWLGVGLAAGLAVLTRTAIAPLLLLIGLFSVVQRATRAPRLTGWLLGLALPVGFLVARNVAVGASPLAMAGGGVFAFVAANAPGADPWQGLVLDSTVIARLLTEGHGDALPTALATLHAQPHLAQLELAKLGQLLHDFEMPNNASFAFYRQHAPILKFLPIDLAVLLPLGLVGAFALVRQKRARVFVALAVVQLLPSLLLQPLSRYRLGLLVALVPLASVGLVRLHALRTENRRHFIAWLVPVAALLAFLQRPLPVDVPPTRAVDHAVAWQFWALPAIQRAQQQQDPVGVAEAMALFLRGEPIDLATWPREVRSERRRIAGPYAMAHDAAAQALALQGLTQDAAMHRKRAEQLQALTR